MTALIDSDYFNIQMTTLGLKDQFKPRAEQLDELILEASEWMENTCRRKLVSGQVVESRWGRGHNRFMLDEWPVTDVASVAWVDRGGITGTVDTALLRVNLNGILEFINELNGPWYSTRYYTVTYTAGYTTVPAGIQKATALKVVDLYRPQFQGARESHPIEFVNNIDTTIADLIEAYRRDRIG